VLPSNGPRDDADWPGSEERGGGAGGRARGEEEGGGGAGRVYSWSECSRAGDDDSVDTGGQHRSWPVHEHDEAAGGKAGPAQPQGPDGWTGRGGGGGGPDLGSGAQLEEVFGESWAGMQERVRAGSGHGGLRSWGLSAFLVKTGDDLRQEQFAMQLVSVFADVFQRAGTRLWLRPYRVVSTGADCGLIEMVPDTVSLEALRAKLVSGEMRGLSEPTLGGYFLRMYGPEGSGESRANCLVCHLQ
jgi:hypothetical protein